MGLDSKRRGEDLEGEFCDEEGNVARDVTISAADDSVDDCFDGYWVDDAGNIIPQFESGDMVIGEGGEVLVDENGNEVLSYDEVLPEPSTVRKGGKPNPISGFRLKTAAALHESAETIVPASAEKVEESLSQIREETVRQQQRMLTLVNETSRPSEELDEDDDPDMRPTMPDIGVVMRWGEKQERPLLTYVEKEEDLKRAIEKRMKDAQAVVDRCLAKNEIIYGPIPDKVFMDPEHLREMKELAEITKTIATMSPAQRGLMVMEKTVRYALPWWESRSSLVRLWGQLDCDVQMNEDEDLLRDLIEVVGEAWLHENEYLNTRERANCFAHVIGNKREELKARIWNKYPEQRILFTAIIAKQTKDD
jgi:hypothetical protein